MWVLTGWATGRNKTTGVEQSVRVQMKYPDYNANEEYAMKAEATGVYRRMYHEWPDGGGHSANEEGS